MEFLGHDERSVDVPIPIGLDVQLQQIIVNGQRYQFITPDMGQYTKAAYINDINEVLDDLLSQGIEPDTFTEVRNVGQHQITVVSLHLYVSDEVETYIQSSIDVTIVGNIATVKFFGQSNNPNEFMHNVVLASAINENQ